MSLLSYFRPSEHLNSSQNPIWMDGLRILLGLFIFVKGLLFIEYASDLFAVFSGQFSWNYPRAHSFTSIIHIIGGLMITVGLLTRLSLICQIPIFLMSPLIQNKEQVAQGSAEFWVAALLVALLLFFMVVGPGRYSLDNKVLRPKADFQQ